MSTRIDSIQYISDTESVPSDDERWDVDDSGSERDPLDPIISALGTLIKEYGEQPWDSEEDDEGEPNSKNYLYDVSDTDYIKSDGEEEVEGIEGVEEHDREEDEDEDEEEQDEEEQDEEEQDEEEQDEEEQDEEEQDEEEPDEEEPDEDEHDEEEQENVTPNLSLEDLGTQQVQEDVLAPLSDTWHALPAYSSRGRRITPRRQYAAPVERRGKKRSMATVVEEEDEEYLERSRVRRKGRGQLSGKAGMQRKRKKNTIQDSDIENQAEDVGAEKARDVAKRTAFVALSRRAFREQTARSALQYTIEDEDEFSEANRICEIDAERAKGRRGSSIKQGNGEGVAVSLQDPVREDAAPVGGPVEFTCAWMGCGQVVKGEGDPKQVVQDHLHLVHGIERFSCQDQRMVTCLWKECKKDRHPFQARSFIRHVSFSDAKLGPACTICGKDFSRKDALDRHQNKGACSRKAARRRTTPKDPSQDPQAGPSGSRSRSSLRTRSTPDDEQEVAQPYTTTRPGPSSPSTTTKAQTTRKKRKLN